MEQTDWPRIVLLYDALGRLPPSPVVDLNRAVAVSMAEGPAAALTIVDGPPPSSATPTCSLPSAANC
ncbi:hypothetical protein MMF94_12660 [Pseudonocardia alaniniphila]|uniref:Uncharacterized protein n=1 Tax=Pseudonocardia alaniniphila TaxID=75291 RepID=A0ABS9TDB7_9PSEU|nr:hypothetical protein [Pseudonocardia alaniniphila]MCH6166534.1 hypothetical protein [Pseudonocardia alaniniphila]